MKLNTSACFVMCMMTSTASAQGVAQAPKTAPTPEIAGEPAPTAEAAPAPQAEQGSLEQPPKMNKGVRDVGFYLRLSGGVGHAWGMAGETDELAESTINSWTGNLMVNVGYMVVPGLAVHGDVFGGFSMSYESDGDDETDLSSGEGGVLAMQTFGAGLTYHIMPLDLFVGAGAGVSVAQATRWTFEELDDDETTTTRKRAGTNPGFGAHGVVGKMFALNSTWALGGSVNYNYQSFGSKDESRLEIDNAHSVWLAFNATFQP